MKCNILKIDYETDKVLKLPVIMVDIQVFLMVIERDKVVKLRANRGAIVDP